MDGIPIQNLILVARVSSPSMPSTRIIESPISTTDLLHVPVAKPMVTSICSSDMSIPVNKQRRRLLEPLSTMQTRISSQTRKTTSFDEAVELYQKSCENNQQGPHLPLYPVVVARESAGVKAIVEGMMMMMTTLQQRRRTCDLLIS